MTERTFDFCGAMWRLCDDICRCHKEFRHIDMQRVVVTFAQTRSPVSWGMQARLTPLRFEGGSLFQVREGKHWTVQRLFHDGREMLYVLTFYLPRFLNLPYHEKLVTVFHELYHIGPAFDGDIRRFSGSCYMHTTSQAEYDRQMGIYVRQYLRLGRPEGLRAFLKLDFGKLCQARGQVIGLRINIPRLIPLKDAG